MKQGDTTIITARCFHGDPASCSHPCPFFFDVRTFLARVRDGKWGLAYKLYRNATVFPAIVSELCEAPCRIECQRGSSSRLSASSVQLPVDVADGKVFFVGDEPLDIRAIESATVRFAKNRKPETYRITPHVEHVAIIGAGLAGLSLALNLSQKAYPVTVFERSGQALPTWATHPKYEYFLDEIRLQFSQVNTEFVYDREISVADDRTLADFTYVHDATNNAGLTAVEAVANGIDDSKSIEYRLQTGKWPEGDSGTSGIARMTDTVRPIKRYVDHSGERHRSIVIPVDLATGYTSEEASLEASRCMGCDCRACMDSCEMLGHYGKRPQKIAIEAYADTKSSPPFSSCTLTRETYSCNLCGHCKTVCPVDVDLEKLFHMARIGRAETHKHPRAFHDFWLRDFEWHRTEGAYFSVPRDTKYIFFPGCKLGTMSPPHTENATVVLKERYNAGILLDCCGAPAYWAGEDILFQSHIDSLREKWETAHKPVFVFACAYCMRLFSEFLPEIKKVSLYELLAENGMQSAWDASGKPFAVFDPCMARSFPDMKKAVRKLAVDRGAAVTELPDENQCCGFGGHMRTANPELFNSIVDRRSSVDKAPYLVYCANCVGTFVLAGKTSVHILDIVFPETDGAVKHNTGLQQQRGNAVRAKAALIMLYKDGEFKPPARPWDALTVNLHTALLTTNMDLRLILTDDVKEAIYEAERSDEVFISPDGAPDGGELRQCCLIRDVVTIWAQYTKRNDKGTAEYTIVDAWNHRMRFFDGD